MRCPRCEESPLRGVTIDHCPRCAGSFYDDGEFKELEGIALRGKLEARSLDLRCPRCEQVMAEVIWPGSEDVLVDVCTGCRGFWMDQGEVARVRRSARGEGPEVVRAAGREVLVLRPRERPAFSWRWVAIGAVVLVASQALVSGGALLFENIQSTAGQQGTWGRVAAQLLAFPLGGLVIGRLSRGHRVAEPAIAAFPAALLVAALGYGDFQGLSLIGLGVGGMLLAPLGAALGERL